MHITNQKLYTSLFIISIVIALILIASKLAIPSFSPQHIQNYGDSDDYSQPLIARICIYTDRYPSAPHTGHTCQPIGTAVYIAPDVFLTAGHVFADTQARYGIILGNDTMPIHYILPHPHDDIALFSLESTEIIYPSPPSFANKKTSSTSVIATTLLHTLSGSIVGTLENDTIYILSYPLLPSDSGTPLWTKHYALLGIHIASDPRGGTSKAVAIDDSLQERITTHILDLSQ